MAFYEGQWALTPSGSRAVYGTWPTEDQDRQYQHYQTYSIMDAYSDLPDIDEHEEFAALSTGNVFATGDLPQGALMSAKVPPSWNGRGSWFAYEELVYDREDSCTLEQHLRGPALKNRLKVLEAEDEETSEDDNKEEKMPQDNITLTEEVMVNYVSNLSKKQLANTGNSKDLQAEMVDIRKVGKPIKISPEGES